MMKKGGKQKHIDEKGKKDIKSCSHEIWVIIWKASNWRLNWLSAIWKKMLQLLLLPVICWLSSFLTPNIVWRARKREIASIKYIKCFLLLPLPFFCLSPLETCNGFELLLFSVWEVVWKETKGRVEWSVYWRRRVSTNYLYPIWIQKDGSKPKSYVNKMQPRDQDNEIIPSAGGSRIKKKVDINSKAVLF